MMTESTQRVFTFGSLSDADLVVGATYRGGHEGHYGDDPLNKLLRCGTEGGFRFRGGRTKGGYRLVVLYTTFDDSDWPDTLDSVAGRFVYYGDNKTPGRGLHDTPKGGNELLRFVFEKLHVTPTRRDLIPPFFVFSKAGAGRDVVFHGLAAPGAPGIEETNDLVASWKTKGAERFQNYRAVFSVLDVPTVPRAWLTEVLAGSTLGSSCPTAWRNWVDTGAYGPTDG